MSHETHAIDNSKDCLKANGKKFPASTQSLMQTRCELDTDTNCDLDARKTGHCQPFTGLIWQIFELMLVCVFRSINKIELRDIV